LRRSLEFGDRSVRVVTNPTERVVFNADGILTRCDLMEDLLWRVEEEIDLYVAEYSSLPVVTLAREKDEHIEIRCVGRRTSPNGTADENPIQPCAKLMLEPNC
jgi:hypothetical protein